MDRILTKTCTADQCAVLMRNSWKYTSIGNRHIRIHPPTSDVSVLPPGPIRYVASIEILDAPDDPWGRVDSDGVEVVSAVFGGELSS